jgi:single-strand selective monofunctional uracil DNA glycosylase
MNSYRQLTRACEKLCAELEPLDFAPPVTHVYNPMVYARAAYFDYLRRYATGPKRIVYMGMNPGPFGMTQTGVPFGEISLVRDFLGVKGRVEKPEHEHPKRPIEGFACTRSEVSGARLWGAIRAKHQVPDKFFAHSFISNYCPLVFMEESGRNRTPDKLRPNEREVLYEACDRHLRTVVETLKPEFVIGIGKFAEGRARLALAGVPITVGTIPHPSPASPAANRGWALQAEAALERLGVAL